LASILTTDDTNGEDEIEQYGKNIEMTDIQ